MYQLTTFTEIDGKKKFKHFDARSKQLATNRAHKHYRGGKWEFYSGKNVVRACATSSEVGQSLKVL